MKRKHFLRMRKARLYGLHMRKLYDRESRERSGGVSVIDEAWDE